MTDADAPSMTLQHAVQSLVASADTFDLAGAMLVDAALKGLAPTGQVPADPTKAAAFWAIIRALTQIHGGNVRSFITPDIVNHALIDDLQAELFTLLSQAQRSTVLTVAGSDRAVRFSASPNLAALVERHCGTAVPMGNARYIVCRGQNEWHPAALGEVGEIRALLVLAVEGEAQLAILTVDGVRQSDMAPGRLLLYFADTTVVRIVGRSNAAEVCALTCGFLSAKRPVRMPPFVRTPDAVAERMLDLAGVNAGDCVVDLGCGDGALLIASSSRGASAIGYELDPALVALARAAVPAGVEVHLEDVRKAPLGGATVVTLFLNPEYIEMLRGRLETELAPGSRVVTHLWPIKGWMPERVDMVHVGRDSLDHRLFCYRRS